jgi:threonine dehydrogenase-like Zn-dependent dehydrogenase
MNAAILTENGFEIREQEIPACSDDEILIKIISCGVCSGDVFVYQNRGEMASNYSRLGHEGSGVITAVGKKVSDFAVGEIITTFSLPAYADYLIATPGNVVKLPPEVDPKHALGEPIACCVHAVNRYRTHPGDRVAVIGCGFMGLICLQLAKYQGAEFICAIDPVEERLAAAKNLGANFTTDPREMDAQSILGETGGFDIIIEAAGTQGALDMSTPLIREHGQLVLVGYHQTNAGLRTVNMEQWNLKAIDVINGHIRREDEKKEAMRKGMELMAQGDLMTEPLISTYPLQHIDNAYTDMISRKPGLIKAVMLME